MSRLILLLVIVAAVMTAVPSAGFADETAPVVAADVAETPVLDQVVPAAAVEVPVTEEVVVATPSVIVPGPDTIPPVEPAEVVSAEEPLEFEPFFDVSTPGNLMAVMGASVPVIMEVVKLIPGVQAVWAGNLLRLLAFTFGALGGLAAYFGAFGGSPTYTLLIAILCGLAGGGGYTLIKYASQATRGTKRMASGFANLGTLTTMLVSGVILICMIGLAGCGTTFTARTGEQTITSIHRGPPGQMIAKVATKTACTVNSAPGDEMLIANPCKAGFVPWYEGFIVTCIQDPCDPGTLTHNPDGTVGCQ